MLFRSRIKAFIERFYCIAEEDPNPPLGRYERYPVKDCALLMTAADNFFWTFDQAVSYYQFALVNYIGFHDKGMLLAGGCGDTNGKPQIDKDRKFAESILIWEEYLQQTINHGGQTTMACPPILLWR